MSRAKTNVEFTAEEIVSGIRAAIAEDKKVLDANPGKAPEDLGFITHDHKKVKLPFPVGPATLAVFDIDVKPNAKTYNLGSKFHPIYLTIPHTDAKGVTAITKAKPVFIARKFTITKAPADPTDPTDQRNIEGKDQMAKKPNDFKFESRESVSGALGESLVLLNVLYKARLVVLFNKKLLDADEIKVSEIIQTVLSSKNKLNPRGAIEDCPIRFGGSFDKFNDKHPDNNLRSTIMTPIREYVGEKDGKMIDKTPKIMNPKTGKEEFLNRSNVHIYLCAGRQIEWARFYLDAAPEAAGKLSVPLKIHRIVVNPVMSGGFDDSCFIDGDKLEAENTATTPPSSPTPTQKVDHTVTPAPAPTQAPAPEPTASEAEINAVLSTLAGGQ